MTTRPVHPSKTADASASAPRQSAPGFEALLERLERDTRAVERAAHDVGDAGELGHAVARARAALDHALELGSSLIEAYRERVQQRRVEERS